MMFPKQLLCGSIRTFKATAREELPVGYLREASTAQPPQLWGGCKAQSKHPSHQCSISFIFPINEHQKSSKEDSKKKKKY